MSVCASKTSKHQGAALVVALLITALVAVIGVRMGNEYQLTLRRSSNVIYSDQILLYLYSAESIAKQLLLADIDKDMDYRGEAWAEEYPPVPIGQGLLAAQPMQDLQGRFNLNSLRNKTVNADPNAQQQLTDNQEMFIRLLLTFSEIVSDEAQASAIMQAVVDWLDEDEGPTGFDGAEDPYYAQLDVPYRTPDVLMSSVSELRLVKGVTAELYRQLEPHVTVLDVEFNEVNINTATKNVLQAVAYDDGTKLKPLPSGEIESYLQEIDPAVGLDKKSIKGFAPWNRLDIESNENIVAQSDYFAISGLAKLGEISIPMRSVLRVDDNDKVTVLSRSTGSL
ncbi:MAG: type II secretion system minor pseudopilin GspK [Pseudomonadota bacterium]